MEKESQRKSHFPVRAEAFGMIAVQQAGHQILLGHVRQACFSGTTGQHHICQDRPEARLIRGKMMTQRIGEGFVGLVQLATLPVPRSLDQRSRRGGRQSGEDGEQGEPGFGR